MNDTVNNVVAHNGQRIAALEQKVHSHVEETKNHIRRIEQLSDERFRRLEAQNNKMLDELQKFKVFLWSALLKIGAAVIAILAGVDKIGPFMTAMGLGP